MGSLRGALAHRPPFAGLAVALVCWCFSLWPSMLPRSWIVQAAVSAVCVVVGYGIGTLIGWLVHVILDRRHWQLGTRVRRAAWATLGAAAMVAVAAGVVLWPRWQNNQRGLVELPRISALQVVPAFATTAALIAVVGMGFRVVWWQIRSVDRWFNRRVSGPSAVVLTAVIVTIAAQLVVRHVVWDSFRSWANNVYSSSDRGTDGGIVRPTTANVSGSTASLVPWDTLGRQGRSFVAGATTRAELRAFHGTPAKFDVPLRVYVGTRSASSLDEQAALAVRELERTGAFDRAVLVVATATGTGWIDPDAATAIEQLYGGDSAIVSIQYSYLPSWVAFLIDGKASAPAGSVLFNAVYQAWARRPATARPKLLVFGESLGSYGAEAAFAGFDARTSLANLVARTDGALFAGPVSTNVIWGQLVRERAPGSPAWRPVFHQGFEAAHVFTRSADLIRRDTTWAEPRVAYLVYPSDPVPVLGLQTLWSPPAWTEEPKAYDIPDRARWFPIITGVQSVGDLVNGFYAAPGHGHNYDLDFVGGWANVTSPDGWTDADTARLRSFLAESRRSG